jgi:CheY-like chemotaxis protein/anti-sigma regulatory factor (Ser/Thr protein kinase)
MSHELRTPLNGVIGLTQVLAAAKLPSMEADAVVMIESCAKSLLSLVDNILDLSKIEAGRLTLEEVAVDLRALVQEVSDVFSVRASGMGIRFISILDADVPQWIECDPARLKQILLNLLSNALKFTHHGEFRLRVSASGGPQGATLCLTIADTGIGISAADQRHLFTRYTQVDSSSTRRYQGTGLGLAISRQLAQLMGGDISVESAVGVGSTFTVRVPLKAAAPVARPAAPPRPARNGARVLVAEDNEVNQVVALRLLSLLGFEDVTVVDNGAEAVDACLKQDFDLILMDCQMPVMDGWEATQELRAHGIRTPVAALTAGATAQDRRKCQLAGMDDFLTKPIELSVLSEKIGRLLALGETGCARAPQASPRPLQAYNGQAMKELFGDDEGALAQTLRMFTARTRGDMLTLGEAHEQQDAATLARVLHRLKGSAGAVGAEALAQCCRDAEQAPPEARRAVLDKLQAAFRDFEEATAGAISNLDFRNATAGH